MTKVTADDLAALIQIFDASDWSEMHLAVGGTEMFLSRDANALAPGRTAAVPAAPAHAPVAAPTTPPARVGVTVPPGWSVIRAPSLGTFYRAPKPGAAPYVTIGQEVTADTEMCLIEVMKLFTAVRAGIAGIVREVCVNDGELVEFEQPLFLIGPHG